MTPQMASVDCPPAMVGRVIGKNGETIRALESYTGAQIQIDQAVDPMKVTITGAPRSLQLAVSMVKDIVTGSFRGFALLRQVSTNAPEPAAPYQPVYAPGYGLIPPSKVRRQMSVAKNLSGCRKTFSICRDPLIQEWMRLSAGALLVTAR